MSDKRIEQDLLGKELVAKENYMGIHTLRAQKNFLVSELKVPVSLIKSLAAVKIACAEANAELGYLGKEKAQAIIAAASEIKQGQAELLAFSRLDALQGGAGTSTNMNINEVIANRALEILRYEKGDYTKIHPIEDVNLNQSTNDVYPTALNITLINHLRSLNQAVAGLQGVLQKKEKEFSLIVKIGRTQLQEAVPITLGAEFAAFAEAFSRDRWRTFKCEERLRVVNIGGTAVGTGICAGRDYIFLVIEKLREITGIGLSRAENLMGQTANADVFVETSAILKAQANNLIKVANDLRMLHLLGEINLPKVQAGSSIMPGKVNPVICEAVISAGIKVFANDFIVSEAASRGTFQICEFLPLIAYAMIESLQILENSTSLFTEHIEKITANKNKAKEYFDNSQTIITAFVPKIGYEKATELIREFTEKDNNSKSNVYSFLVEKLGKDTLRQTLSPEKLLALGYRKEQAPKTNPETGKINE